MGRCWAGCVCTSMRCSPPLVIPFYMLNEWLVLDGGLGLTRGFVDSAGSIVIHAFGAYFGLGLALALTRKGQRAIAVQSDETSDRFAMLGSMVLWIFWPSFCSAVRAFGRSAPHRHRHVWPCAGQPWRPSWPARCCARVGRPSPTWPMQRWPAAWPWAPPCNVIGPTAAFVVGLLAGNPVHVGYVVIQPRVDAALKIVRHLRRAQPAMAMPGLLGGLAAAVLVPASPRRNSSASPCTVLLAFVPVA